MKTIYLECKMGIAGDMLIAALFELVEDKTAVIDAINNIGIPETKVFFEKITSGFISGTRASVSVCNQQEGESYDNTHFHNKLSDVKTIINSLNVSQTVKSNAAKIYDLIAEAESAVHNQKVEQIHFHEVGMLDAVCDIVTSCFLLEWLGVENIIISAINVGSGVVKCAHGILPVPAPASAYILKGVPFYSGDIKSELATPTGCALAKFFANKYGNMPVMTVEKIGYGFGKKEFSQPNCLRAFLGKTDDNIVTDNVIELACNIDDMTGEDIAFACEMLIDAGALDVASYPIVMKKGRHAVCIKIICNPESKHDILAALFKHTSTLGVREYNCSRYVLNRCYENINTKYGDISLKKSSGFGVEKSKFEYDDIAKIAKDNNLSLEDIKKLLK